MNIVDHACPSGKGPMKPAWRHRQGNLLAPDYKTWFLSSAVDAVPPTVHRCWSHSRPENTRYHRSPVGNIDIQISIISCSKKKNPVHRVEVLWLSKGQMREWMKSLFITTVMLFQRAMLRECFQNSDHVWLSELERNGIPISASGIGFGPNFRIGLRYRAARFNPIWKNQV